MKKQINIRELQKHIDEHRTLTEIGNIYGLNRKTILKQLKDTNIRKRCKYCDRELNSYKKYACTECIKSNKESYNSKYKQREDVKKKSREQSKQWRNNNPEKYKANYQKQNSNPIKKKKDKIRYINKKNDDEYKKRHAINNKKYRINNPEKINTYHRRYIKKYLQKKKNDPEFQKLKRIRSLIRKKVLAYHKDKTTNMDNKYGIDLLEIAKHIGVCPGNPKDYHIDHIIALKNFNLSNAKDFNKAFSPSNHQWLKENEHLEKTRQESSKWV